MAMGFLIDAYCTSKSRIALIIKKLMKRFISLNSVLVQAVVVVQECSLRTQ